MCDGLPYHRTIDEIPAADMVKEENILKFYYVRSIDEYWIGRRLDTLYYARYESESQQWVWTHSRYLPWGEHVVSPTSLWKEHTYPSEPEEIPFTDWLQGFAKKYIAADVVEVVRCKDCKFYAEETEDCDAWCGWWENYVSCADSFCIGEIGLAIAATLLYLLLCGVLHLACAVKQRSRERRRKK